ncbi:uncharacterized protein ABDE67_008156 [Symphorus nematophorus]
MSFLTIPSQEGLFTTIKSGKSAERAESRSPLDDEDNNDDDDEDDDTDVHLIPRCSPVPRKRGASIFDETAEYMRIQQALPAGKRVSFADATGEDLVDVKTFVAFDSDDEEASARWEEEEAKYRKPQREPTYQVHPEFNALGGSALLQAVRSNKVEVELLSPAENEPLAFTGVIRVLNISFNKAVYIRSTMDSWATYFDHPAEYVQGSHDGETDKFSFKLSFAPPYTTHGSRIEFVVRYETSDGDFWANNSSMNYVVTLLLSYEDDSAQTTNNIQQMKGILRPPKDYSVDDDFDSEDEQEKEEEEAGTSKTGLVTPTAACPVIIQPEIDIEIAVHPSGPSVPPNQELPSVDGTLSAHTVSPGERFPCMSSETTLQTNSSFVLCASESVQPNKSQPLPRLHCELGNQTSEQSIDSSPSALLPASTPSLQEESRPTSDSSQAGGEEIPSSEASGMYLPTAETNLSTIDTNLWPETDEDGSTKGPDRHPCPELPASTLSSQQESRPRSDRSLPSREKIPPSETPCMHLATTDMNLPAAETNLWPESREDASTNGLDSHPCLELPASIPPLQQDSRPRSDRSQAGREDIPASEASCMHLPTAEMNLPKAETTLLTAEANLTTAETNLWPETGEIGSTDSPASCPCLELSASIPSLQQELRQRSDRSQAGAEEIPASEASCMHPPVAETNLQPEAGEDGSTEDPAGRPCLELPAECISAPSVTQGYEREVAEGLSEVVAGLSEGSSRSAAAHHEGSMPALSSPVAESQVSLGAEGEAPPSPELAENPSVSTGVTEVSQNSALLQSVSAWGEEEDAAQISPDTLLENLPNTQSEVSELQSEHDVNRNLMPSVVFLSGVVSLSIVLQEPSALFLIGLLMVLHRL